MGFSFCLAIGISFIALGNKLEDYNYKMSGNLCLWIGLIFIFVGIIVLH